MKTHEVAKEFLFPWQSVTKGLWLRYPNPFSNHMLSEDVLERRMLPDGRLFTKRLLVKASVVPAWGKYIMRHSSAYIVEESIVDVANSQMQTYTYNISSKKVLNMHEKVTYTATNDNSTIVDRRAWMHSSILGFQSALEKFSMDRFKKQIVKTEKGFLWTIMSNFGSEQDKSLAKAMLPAKKLSLLDDKFRERVRVVRSLARDRAKNVVKSAAFTTEAV